MQALGIDIGGSGIKGAPVDVHKGKLLAKRVRIATPNPPTAKKVTQAVNEIVQYFNWESKIGVGFPGIVRDGHILTAANMHESWVHVNAEQLFTQRTQCACTLINDADAAGLAEMHHGAGKGHKGKVILLTFGTGIGSALFLDGKLVSNTEFGHLQLRGKIAEARASDRARSEEKLSWKSWGKRVAEYLAHLELLFSPDLFIIGGGASKNFDLFKKSLKRIHAEIVPALHGNSAGIVGAAMAASGA
ncbi:ROK family protein [candidate division KSB1 bacterium]|nr:ROK family protein [candidate division KSB1 bacterium]